MKVSGQRHALVALFAGEGPSKHCTGGWLGRLQENFQKYIAPLEFPPLIHRQHLKVFKTIQLHRVHKIFV
jgi:hypothetical protein